MNLDRILTLARALEMFEVEVRFALAKYPSDEHRWMCCLNVSGGFIDYGPTPEAAAEALETCLRRKVEWKMEAAMLTVRQFESALEPSSNGEPK